MKSMHELLRDSPRMMQPTIARQAVELAIPRHPVGFRKSVDRNGVHLGWTFEVLGDGRPLFGWISRFGLITRSPVSATRAVADSWLRIAWEGIVRPVTPHVPGECASCARLSVELIEVPYRTHPDAVDALRRMERHTAEGRLGLQPTAKQIVAYSEAIYAHQ